MSEPQGLQLSFDAHGLDTIRVQPRRYGNGPQVHLAVRTGSVLIYCLDSAAIASIAGAWAQAQASTALLLPTRASTPQPVSPARRAGAWPTADVVAEGHQRWDVITPRPGRPFAVVTSDWLTVRIPDQPALQTYTQTWARACAWAAQNMPNPPPVFDRLLRSAFEKEFTRQYREDHPGYRGTDRGR
jgi:hypothetical protein